MTVLPPRFGLIIVGDEILSGKRADKHLAKTIELLAQRGLPLSWAHYLPDDRAAIAAALARTLASDDVVFCCGGIGSTPDDHTRQAAAQALGVPLELHPQARELITLRCAELAAQGRGTADMATPENRQRLKMGEFPAGARIVANAYNRIPGFAVGRHYFLPGFPVMAWPMIEAVLEAEFSACFNAVERAERSLLVYDTAESLITPLMEEAQARYPDVKAYSLPSMGDGLDGKPLRRHIELGVKGDPRSIDAAFEIITHGVAALGVPHELHIGRPEGRFEKKEFEKKD